LPDVEVALALAAAPPPRANWWKEIEQRDRATAAESREHMARQAAAREQRFKDQQERERVADEERRIERHRALGWPV
jgi:hypothetical protein